MNYRHYLVQSKYSSLAIRNLILLWRKSPHYLSNSPRPKGIMKVLFFFSSYYSFKKLKLMFFISTKLWSGSDWEQDYYSFYMKKASRAETIFFFLRTRSVFSHVVRKVCVFFKGMGSFDDSLSCCNPLKPLKFCSWGSAGVWSVILELVEIATFP